MNILFTLNNAFVPQVATCMCSIFENNKSMDEINIYLLNTDISEANKAKLQEFTKLYGRSVHFITLPNLRSLIDFDFDTNGWSPIVLARLLVDKLLPEDIDRILYLDGDTLVLGSLESLWKLDMGNCSIGMGPESTVDAGRREFLGLGKQMYCNAGVLLINLEKWRERKLGESSRIL